MGCPYCGDKQIMYSEKIILHAVRVFTGSPKRYCMKCHKKWMNKKNAPSHLFQELFVIVAVILIVMILIEFLMSGEANQPVVDGDAGVPSIVEMAQLRGAAQGGSPKEIFNSLSSGQRAKVKKYMQSADSGMRDRLKNAMKYQS